MEKLDVYNAPTGIYSDSKPSVQNRKAQEAYIDLLSGSIHKKLLSIEPWLRRSIPFIIILFLIVLAAVRFVSIYDLRHTIDKDTRSTMNLLAAHIVNTIDRDLSAVTKQGKTTSLSHSHLEDILVDLRNQNLVNTNTIIAIVDQNENVLASSSSEVILGKPLKNFISENTALESLRQHTGATQIKIGTEPALALLSQTKNSQYSVFMSEKTHDIYIEWRKIFSLNMTLFIGTTGIILALLYAYYNQVLRAHNMNLVSEKIKTVLIWQ